MYVFNIVVSTKVYVKSEFDFIHSLRRRSPASLIGDDCAVLPKDAATDLLVTADMLIEDIDFRLDWTKPEFLGHKALAVSLSDIAAMGGRPIWAMLSIGVPETIWKSDFVDRFYNGWFELAAECGVELVGGDLSRAPDKLVIDSIVGGEVAKGRAIRRSGTKIGDRIFVSGSLGGAAGGLKLLESGERLNAEMTTSSDLLIIKQLKPCAKLAVSNILQTLQLATSMIDLSDGLSSDLAHICSESHVGAIIQAEKVPVDDDLQRVFGTDTAFDLALHGGEDFALLFTVSPENSLDVPGACIGEITESGIDIVDGVGTRPLEPLGFQHFQ